VACELARGLSSGVIVAILPDGGERYLSTELFEVAEPEIGPARLTFLNGLTRRREAFEPAADDGVVTMYSCGPTVHARPHLGLLRRLLAADLIQRTLEHAGHEVRHVVSITDFDDNTLSEAERTGEPMAELCARHEAEFHEDVRTLGIRPAHTYVRASEFVDEMVGLTKELVERGAAYEKLRSVYFDIGRVPSYGELSGTDLSKIRLGATVDLDRYEKDDPRDFTLLRRSTLAELRRGASHKTEWGNVRPSWHVQCSAMARATLGERFDIHTASVDLVFPHNENEIAQSRALTGEPQARFWLHSELVRVGGKKMTYAPETCVTLPDLLERGLSPREVRFLLLCSHYRQPVHLTDEQLAAARASLRRIDECVRNLRAVDNEVPCVTEVEAWIADMLERVRVALFDDVNTSAALAALFRLVRQANYLMADARLCTHHAGKVLDAMERVDTVLAILPPAEAPPSLPSEVEDRVREREEARAARDFERADRIRAELSAEGWRVEDRPEGTRVTRRG